MLSEALEHQETVVEGELSLNAMYSLKNTLIYSYLLLTLYKQNVCRIDAEGRLTNTEAGEAGPPRPLPVEGIQK